MKSIVYVYIHIEMYSKGCLFLDRKISSGFYFVLYMLCYGIGYFCYGIIYSYTQNNLFSSKGLLNHIYFAYKIFSPLHLYNSCPVSDHYFLQYPCNNNIFPVLIVITHICVVLPSLQSTFNTLSSLRVKTTL